MTDYNKLAQECLNKYPNRKIVVVMNPYYVGSGCELGEYDDVSILAEDLKEATATFTEVGEKFGMDWLDVFPVEYTPEELAELEQKHEEWVDSLFDDWD